MKRIGMLFMLLFVVLGLKAQDYDKMWKSVDAAANKDLPQTALAEVKKIYQRAVCDNQEGQRMRAQLMAAVYAEAISPDSALYYVRQMQQVLATENRPVQRALWHSALGQVYARWHGSGLLLEPLSARSTSDEAIAHFEASLKVLEPLADARYTNWLPLFQPNPQSHYFNNDLLHVLLQTYCKHASQNPVKLSAVYGRAIQCYRLRGNRNAELLLTLDSLAVVNANRMVQGKLQDDVSFRQLLKLSSRFEQLPVNVRTYEQLVHFYYPDGTSVAAANDSLLVDIAKRGIQLYGKLSEADYARALQNFLRSKQAPSARLEQFFSVIYPGARQQLTLTTRNLTKVKLRVTPVSDSRVLYDRDVQTASNSRYLQKLVARNRKQTTVQLYTLHKLQPWQSQSQQVEWQTPSRPGVYVAELEVQGNILATHVFSVSAVGALVFSPGGQNQRVTIVDSRSGNPLPHACVAVYRADLRSRIKVYEASDSGTIQVDVPRNQAYRYTYYASVPGDQASVAFNLAGSNSYTDGREESTSSHLDLFTDRAVYRPGQQLSFTGVVYSRKADHFSVKRNVKARVTLFNANHKLIDSLQVITNEFGNLNGTFRLPAAVLPGRFTLRVQASGVRGEIGFRVESYKRPTFTATTVPLSSSYQLGDTVQVYGKAQTYSSIPLQGARVQYRINRMVWGWREAGNFEPQTGETFTDSIGHFVLPVWLDAPSLPLNQYIRYFYRISYDMTAANGETVHGEATLPVATHPARYEATIPEVVCKEKLPEFCVNLFNAAGQNLPQSIPFVLEQDKRVCLRDTLQTGIPFRLPALATLSSGAYTLRLPSVCGAQSDTFRLMLFSMRDTRLASGQMPFFFQENRSMAGDKVCVSVGSSETDACLFYDLVSNNRVIASKCYELTDSLLHLNLQYFPEYADGATAYFALVRDGKFYTAQTSVVKPQPDKRLLLSWQTFRSRLIPGQHEEWVLSVTHPDGTPAAAALMARLYDASLDAFARSSWNFTHIATYRRLPNAYWSFKTSDSRWGVTLDATLPVSLLHTSPWNYAHWQHILFAYRPMYLRGNRIRFDSVFGVANAKMMGKSMNLSMQENESSVEEAIDANVQVPEGTLRTNFNETAFFCPSLRTDTQGKVRIAFTLPQSLTQWNFNALAYDEQMNSGRLDTVVVARKDFMVEPALPRFLRPGDKTRLPVKVTNLTDHSVEARLVLTLTRDTQSAATCYEQAQMVALAAGETRVYGFDYTADAECNGLICRVVATGKSFADGEEHYLPVCADRVEVVRSIPFTLTGAGTYTLRVDTLFSARQLEQPRLRVELSSNPAWYAVTSLPVLSGNINSHSALEWATRFYAIALGRRVAELNPQLLDQINNRPEALGELVDIQENRLNDDTPWLQQGEAQRQRTETLPLLFDDEWAALHLGTAIDKLSALQTVAGAWSWYPGMAGNRQITVEVALMLARVQRLAENYQAAQQLAKATAYLRREVADDVRDMKQREGAEHIRLAPLHFHLKYLYLLSMLGERPDADAHYLLDRLVQLRKELTMYEKAVAAVVLADFGRDAESRVALQSLLEYTVSAPDKGRWFETSRAEWSQAAYRIPTQCAAIEALAHFGRNAEADDMRLWLLQARRTQLWETPQATADAVYALLATAGSTYSATDLAATTPVYYTLYRGSKVVGANAPSQAQSPVSYFSKTYTEGPAVEATTLKVEKRNPGLSWGSVTAGFSLPESMVQTEGAGFMLNRRFEVKRGSTWKPLEDNSLLRQGERVRQVFTLVAERDYDFVSLHSVRPACLEPTQPLSGYHWAKGFSTYRVVRDAETIYYIEQVRKGTHIFSEELFVDRSGRYTSGIAEVSCVLAPEFRATAASASLIVE